MSGSTRIRPARRRRRRDKPPALQTLLLGSLVVAAIAVVCFTLLRVYNGIPTVDYRTTYISVPTTGNLLPHDAVRVGGTRVGQVLRLDIGSDGRPRVELQLDPGTKLPRDTTVAVRANGLLGARYVALTPGRSRKLLPDGATISGGPKSYTYGLPDAVAVFDNGARGGLKRTVSGLAQGLRANGAPLNGSLQQLGGALGDFNDVARSILRRQGAAARLIPALESAAEPLARVRSYARPFLQSAGDALGPFITERDATRETIARAPAALAAAETGLQRGAVLLAAVHRLASAAERTLPGAPVGLRHLAGLLREARQPLRDANPTVKRLRTTARFATKALVATEPVVPRIKSGVDTARPILAYIDKHACDVVNTGVVLRSMTGFGQPGEGPNGGAMAFRLQAIIPAGLEAVGIKDQTGILRREAYEAPCKYISRPYPQLVPTPRRGDR